MNPLRLRLVVAAVLAAVGATLVVESAHAADDDPDFQIRIDRVAPALISGKHLVVSGTVTNNGSGKWHDLQVYLAVPANPFTTRPAMAKALAGEASYTGERIVELPYIDELPDIARGKTAPFSISIPISTLGFSMTQGVYPVGVHLLATAPDGTRAARAAARTASLLPLVSAEATASATVVWPFVLTEQRDARDRYPDKLADRFSGQLRNLLNAARATPTAGSTILIDPALLDAAEDIGAGRNGTFSDKQRKAAETFLTDLRELANRSEPLILGYGNPDQWAVSAAARISGDLRQAIDTATERAAKHHRIQGRRAVWLTEGGASETVLQQARADDVILMSAGDLTGWEPSMGPLVHRQSGTSTESVLVLDSVLADLPRPLTAATVRQAIIAETALAAIARTQDSASREGALIVIPADWDPGDDTTGVADALGAAPAAPQSITALLAGTPRMIESPVGPATATALDRHVLDAAALLAERSGATVELASGNADLAGDLAKDVALLTSVHWRGATAGALAVAAAREAALSAQMNTLTIEGPPSFTLPGTKGRFPLTITNGASFDVSVGVRLDSSNPALTIEDVAPVTIAAGGRHTLNVTVDVGRQKSSSVTATLLSPSGDQVGEPTEFNLRSSNVGSVVWVAMAGSGLLVVIALFRRMVRQRRSGADDG